MFSGSFTSNFCLLLCLFYICASVGYCAEKEWTIVVFCNADNNLEADGIDDLNEMEKIGSTSKVNVIAMLDKWDNKGTKTYFIEKDSTDQIVSPVIRDDGEADMGDFKEAVSLFDYALENYPAKRYMVVVWNHGSGWKDQTRSAKVLSKLQRGISYDDTNDSHITTAQIGQMVREMARHLGRKIDVIGYDACLMQMAEVACEIKDHALVQVGSEESEPGGGWPYHKWLKKLARKPSMTGRQVASLIVKEYCKSYRSLNPFKIRAVTQSAIDLTVFDEFTSLLDQFAIALCNCKDKQELANAISFTQSYALPEYRDLVHFTECVTKTIEDKEVLNTAARLRKFIKGELVIANDSVGSRMKNSNGISIYLPWKTDFDKVYKDFSRLSLAKLTHWDEFLAKVYHPQESTIDIEYAILEEAGKDLFIGDELSLIVTLVNQGLNTSGEVSVIIESGSEFLKVSNEAVNVDEIQGLELTRAPVFSVEVLDGCPTDERLDLVVVVTDEKGRQSTKEVHLTVKEAFAVKQNVLLVTDKKFCLETKAISLALEQSDIPFDWWPSSYYNEPMKELFQNYIHGAIILGTTARYQLPSELIEELARYLESGGRLFIFGDDIGWEHEDGPFYEKYLRSKFIQDDVNCDLLAGKALFENTELSIYCTLAGNMCFADPDEIDPLDGAEAILSYIDNQASKTKHGNGVKSSGTAAVAVDTGVYRLVYMAFDFEQISGESNRAFVMKSIMDYLAESRDSLSKAGKSVSATNIRNLKRKLNFRYVH